MEGMAASLSVPSLDHLFGLWHLEQLYLAREDFHGFPEKDRLSWRWAGLNSNFKLSSLAVILDIIPCWATSLSLSPRKMGTAVLMNPMESSCALSLAKRCLFLALMWPLELYGTEMVSGELIFISIPVELLGLGIPSSHTLMYPIYHMLDVS